MIYLEAWIRGILFAYVIYIQFKLFFFFQNPEQYIGKLHPNISNMPQHNYFWPTIIDFHIGQASGFFHAKVFLLEWIYLNTEDCYQASLVCAPKFISLVENFLSFDMYY